LTLSLFPYTTLFRSSGSLFSQGIQGAAEIGFRFWKLASGSQERPQIVVAVSQQLPVVRHVGEFRRQSLRRGQRLLGCIDSLRARSEEHTSELQSLAY